MEMSGCERFELNTDQPRFAMYVKGKDRITKRALDAGDSAAFSAFFWLQVFSAPK